MSEALISVCIPAYNHEKYIAGTIKSIIFQSYKNIELIVIDDGSSDNTLKIINTLYDECKQRFEKVLVLHHEKNRGTCSTLNQLIKLAKGEYVFFIASDDIAKPDALKYLHNSLNNNHEYVLAVGDNEIIDSKASRIGWNESREAVNLDNARYKTFGEYLQKTHRKINFHSEQFGNYTTLLDSNYIPNGYLILATALNNIPPFSNNAPLEDWYLMLQLSKKGRFKYIDKILYSYRWHDHNTVKNKYFMRHITIKTLQFEKNLVDSDLNKKWSKIYNNQTIKIKNKFNFINILNFYKITDPFKYQYILELFGKKIILKEKKLS